MSGQAVLNHAHFNALFATVAAAPVVELLRMYFPLDVDTGEVEKVWTGFMKVLEENAEGYHSTSCGWVVEDLDYEKVDGKAKGFTAAIGWESIEAHAKYRNTQMFKDSILKVRNIGKGSTVVSLKMLTLTARPLIQVAPCQIYHTGEAVMRMIEDILTTSIWSSKSHRVRNISDEQSVYFGSTISRFRKELVLFGNHCEQITCCLVYQIDHS
jgi:hypothetical protein